MRVTAEQRRRQKRIAAALAGIDFALPGSIQTRLTRCGKPTCRCHSDEAARHGPYLVWTRKVNARTVTKVLTEDQLENYRGWMDNARQLRQLVEELHQLTLDVIETDLQSAPKRRRSQPHPADPP